MHEAVIVMQVQTFLKLKIGADLVVLSTETRTCIEYDDDGASMSRVERCSRVLLKKSHRPALRFSARQLRPNRAGGGALSLHPLCPMDDNASMLVDAGWPLFNMQLAAGPKTDILDAG
jgi:hypothetical protein